MVSERIMNINIQIMSFMVREFFFYPNTVVFERYVYYDYADVLAFYQIDIKDTLIKYRKLM